MSSLLEALKPTVINPISLIDLNASILWLVACESEQANFSFFLIIIFSIEAIFGLGEKVKN